MRIRMVLYVDVDEKRWADSQGIEVKQVRQDVEKYVRNSARELPLITECALESER